MSLKLYREVDGALEPRPVQPRDWRSRLKARRWAPAALANPEAQALRPIQGLLFFGGLAALTFALLLLGYLTGFWA
ncbi:MAG: hypothetical protein ACHQZR_09495 [Candidatus Limnocylindrales bacterium]